jgi:pimeloyl-ACP methyl ester carboxylesterase
VKLIASIAFHFNPERLDYLRRVLNMQPYLADDVPVWVTTNTDTMHELEQIHAVVPTTSRQFHFTALLYSFDVPRSGLLCSGDRHPANGWLRHSCEGNNAMERWGDFRQVSWFSRIWCKLHQFTYGGYAKVTSRWTRLQVSQYLRCATLMALVIGPLAAFPQEPISLDSASDGRAVDDVVVDWTPCGPHYKEGTAGECARVAVPLRRDKPNSISIDVAVKRFTIPRARGAIWLNDGGPGGSGWNFEYAALGIIKTLNAASWDVYIYTHRGTAVSENGTEITGSANLAKRLTAEQITAWNREIAQRWGGDEIGFDSYEAANDLAALIKAAHKRDPSQRVALYGVSYGSYVVQRFLQRYPQGADVAVLDGVVPLGIKNYPVKTALDIEATMKKYFKRCASIPACVDRLGQDPVATGVRGFKAVADNTCDIGDKDAVIRPRLFGVLRHPALPYVIALRASRCNAADRIALGNLIKNGSTLIKRSEKQLFVRGFFDLPANFAIFRTDMLPLSFDRPFWRTALAGNLFFPATNNDSMVLYYKYWSPYPETVSHRDDTRRAARIPVLIVHGDLDLTTPTGFLKSTVKWLHPTAVLRIPTGGHGNALFTGRSDCATINMLAFIDDPGAPLTTRCLRRIDEVVDFAGTRPESSGFARAYLDGSLWGED